MIHANLLLKLDLRNISEFIKCNPLSILKIVHADRQAVVDLTLTNHQQQ